MDVNGYPFAIPLDREFMRTPPEEEFLSDREYTVLVGLNAIFQLAMRGIQYLLPVSLTSMLLSSSSALSFVQT
jgi:hypothetical protein